MTYDFSLLSPSDFESITRDLLSRHLNLELHQFAAGPDGGIDLRYATDASSSVVVQCKHYRRSSLRHLCSHMERDELPKLRQLKPQRYILVTSLPLTPANADRLFSILRPYLRTVQDIIGRDQLNALLRGHPDIEHTHFKLWLTSSAVLDAILHNDSYVRTTHTRETLQHRLALYVPTPSIDDVCDRLTTDRCCIITGVPGIGKTTLAEMVINRHLAAGWQLVTIHQNINEAHDVFSRDSSARQLFYYDDFLGTISLGDKLAKNEDKALVAFVNCCRRHQNRRLLLTTREYIFRQATRTHEVLAAEEVGLLRYALELDDYSLLMKAKILANHLFFNDIPPPYISALIENQCYKTLITHRNYSPRIIEWMTQTRHYRDCEPQDYAKSCLLNLDKPESIWEHAFTEQLTEASRGLLYTLATLPKTPTADAVENAFDAYRQQWMSLCAGTRSPRDFRRACQELEGSFIAIVRVGNERSMTFHNPSIHDFMTAQIQSDAAIQRILLGSLQYFDQLQRMVSLCCSDADSQLRIDQTTIRLILREEEVLRTALGTHCPTVSSVGFWPFGRTTIASDLIWLHRFGGHPACNEFDRIWVELVTTAILEERLPLSDLYRLLRVAVGSKWIADSSKGELLIDTRDRFLGANGFADMCIAVDWIRNCSSQVDLSSEELETFASDFVECAREECEGVVGVYPAYSADDIDEMIQELECAMIILAVDLRDQVTDLEWTRDDLLAEPQEADDDGLGGPRAARVANGAVEDALVRDVFESLERSVVEESEV